MGHRRGSFRGQRVSETQRRKRSWQAFTDTLDSWRIVLNPPALVSAGSTLALVSFDGAGTFPGLIESTILRMRGMLDMPKSVMTAATQTIQAFGIGFVTNEAALAGAVPNPATASGAEWDGWMFIRTSTQIALDIQGTVLDIKAMRKWDTGQSLVFVAGAETDSTTTGNDLFKMSIRGLFLLP